MTEERRVNSFTDRDFGRLETEVVGLKAQNVRLENRIEELNRKVDLLVSAVTEAKGGWKMLLAVGAASASIGAVVSKMVLWIKGI